MKTLFLLVAFVLSTLGCLAQADRLELGLLGGGSLNIHSASFSQLGDFASCCPEFTGGQGWAFTAGAFTTIPLGGVWRLQARLVYSGDRGTLTSDEETFVADLRDTARVVQGLFRHELTANLSSFGLEPYIAIRPVGALDLLVGGRVALVTSSSFVQTETLVEPADYGAYLGANRTWVNHNSEIQNASSVRASLSLGMRYVVPLNSKGTLFAAPEVFYHLPLTEVASGTNWSISEMRFGIEIGWSPEKQEDVFDEIDTTYTPPPSKVIPPVTNVVSSPTLKLVATGIDGTGSVVQFDSILVEETRVVDLLPLLGHIYFSEGSSEIPSRYATSQNDSLNNIDPLVAIHNVLSIVASRMRDNTDVDVTLVGTVSNTQLDRGTELARSRAEKVRDALATLGVSRNRIKISSRKLPKMFTKSSNPDEQYLADEENRRVEIIPTDSRLLNPVELSSVRRTVTPPFVELNSEIDAPAGVAEISTETNSDLGSAPGSIRLSRPDPASVFSLDGISEDSSEIRLAMGEVVDSLGAIGRDTLIVPVKLMTIERKRSERRADVEIERYSLILFAFDDATITGEHERLLQRIRDRMKEGAKVRILGMTDKMGKSGYNKELSRKRASRVAKALGLDSSAIEAVGDTQPRFSNNIPEGRAYNRTVVIEVTMPIR